MVSNQDREVFRAELVQVVSRVAKDKRLLAQFLHDVLTPTEFDEIAARWQIVKLLHAGVPHHEIAKRTHTAVATVTRGSREMRDPQGGFRLALRALKL